MNARTQESLKKNIMSLQSINELQDVQYILKLRWSQLKQIGAMSFGTGDRVHICHSERRGGRVESGVVEKVNRTTVIVRTDAGGVWRCSPSVLEKI